MTDDSLDFGQLGMYYAASDVNFHAFQSRQRLGRVRTTMLAKKVEPGQNGQAGTVDVQLLTNQLDGEGKQTANGVVYSLPYVRHHNGQHAVVMDPVVGDIGPIHIMDRDISANVSARGQANPGSNRRFDPSDGIYLGGILNAAATTFLQMNGGKAISRRPTEI